LSFRIVVVVEIFEIVEIVLGAEIVVRLGVEIVVRLGVEIEIEIEIVEGQYWS